MNQTIDTPRTPDPDQMAPDPRAQYDSPQSLAQDISLDIRQREVLLREWKYDLEQRLGSVAEGLSASTPDRIPDQSKLSAELRCVTEAWDAVTDEISRAS